MQGDDPPFLPVGTDVSAKCKGAFCEAKIKKVVRNIKCKVTLKVGGTTTVNDDVIKGTLRVGSTVEVKLDAKKDPIEAVITKIQDCSQYTVVFDDGDITTLRRSALCLRGGRHFNESETLDQLPLTHPEHFSTPVIAGRRGGGGRVQSDESEGETPVRRKAESTEREPHVGKVVLVESSGGAERRRPQQPAFPALVVVPTAQIKVKEGYLVRSFKDGRYYTVPKKEAREFRKGSAPIEWSGVDAALQYLNNGVLPPHWDKDSLFNDARNSSDDSSDDEPREEKDHFVAQLYGFMDDRGTPLNRNPTIANKDIDLYRLFRVVQKLGGYNRVTNQNQWKTVAEKMGFHPVTSAITAMCNKAYKKFLYSFEDFYRKLGVTLVAHPRGARTPPAGRSLIRDRDKQPPSTSPAPSTTSSGSQRMKGDKDSDKSETDKSEKEEKIEKPEKEKERVKTRNDTTRGSDDGEDSADNQPLIVPKTLEKTREKEKETKDVKEVKEKEKEKEKETKDTKDIKEKDKDRDSLKSVEEKRLKRSHSKTPSLTPIKTEPQDKKTPKPRRPLSTRAGSTTPSTSRASRRPHVSTDSDSSGRASRCGITKKMQSRRSQSANSASSGNTIASSNSSKRPRKRKITEPSSNEPMRANGSTVKAQVGDKLKVYYGPTQSESKSNGPQVTYEAKVIEISNEGMLRVHYTGWNTRYDEWIKPQRIAINVTQQERAYNKKNPGSSRRARAKRNEESSARSDTDSDTDSDSVDVKRPPKKLDDKTPGNKTPLHAKESKSSDSGSSTKSRKRSLRTIPLPAAITPAKKIRQSSSPHQGRDCDLNEIRSELKGLSTVKQEPDDVKQEPQEKEVTIEPELPQPEKQAEDVCEFKEPEPFELDLLDEKKKRTHRIFDDISPSKYTSALNKSLGEEISEDPLRARVALRSASLSPFREYASREQPQRHSTEDDSKDAMFSVDDDSMPGEGSSGPIFEGFTPAKNQETYSKKNKVLKLRELIEDSPDSPADDEQSSDDDADTDVKEEPVDGDSSPSALNAEDSSKTPERAEGSEDTESKSKSASPDQESVSKSTSDKSSPPPSTIEVKIGDDDDDEEELPIMAIKTSSIPLPGDMDVASIPLPSTEPTEQNKIKIGERHFSSEHIAPASPLIDTEEEKSEPDSPARIEVPEPPPAFRLQSEGPKIAEKLLKALSARSLSLSPPPAEERPKTPKKETVKPAKEELTSPVPEVKTPAKCETPKRSDVQESVFGEPVNLMDKIEPKKVKSVSPRLSTSPLSILERRKSIADLPLPAGGKNSRLSDTIQKLSSQINQATANIPLPPFPPTADDESDSTDTDDSDRRLIIDKVAENWPVSSEPARCGLTSLAHAAKSAGEWSAGESLLMLEDACKNERKHSASVVVAGSGGSNRTQPAATASTSASTTTNQPTAAVATAADDDSNISLLLCSETIPGSPAPEQDPNPPFACAADDDRAGDHQQRLGESAGGAPEVAEGARAAEGGAGAAGRREPRWGRLLDNTPPTAPDSSLDMSPRRERRISERDSPSERKDDDDEERPIDNGLANDKQHLGMRSRKASECSGAGSSRRGRRRRDTDDASARPVGGGRFNFYVEMDVLSLDPSWDAVKRINLLTSRLSDLRKTYHNVKAELAAIDRRRKKLRRKEREAVKAAKAACS